MLKKIIDIIFFMISIKTNKSSNVDLDDLKIIAFLLLETFRKGTIIICKNKGFEEEYGDFIIFYRR